MATIRQAVPAAMLLALGIQTIFVSFFLSVLGVGINLKKAAPYSVRLSHRESALLVPEAALAQSSPVGGQ